MIDADFEGGGFDMSWRPANILDIVEDARNAVLNEVVMTAIRIVLPDPAQVSLYEDLMVEVPGLAMTSTPLAGTDGAELINVAWKKYLIVRAVIASKWGTTGNIPFAETRIIQLRTILTNFI